MTQEKEEEEARRVIGLLGRGSSGGRTSFTATPPVYCRRQALSGARQPGLERVAWGLEEVGRG